MALSEKLRELRRSAGLTQPRTAEWLTENGCAVTNKAVSKWERGETCPDGQQLLLLCRLYGVRDVLSVFMDDVLQSPVEQLNSAGRARMEEYVSLLLLSDEFRREPIKRRHSMARSIPLYDLPVSAGTGQFLDSEHYELIDCGEDVPLSATFAVRVAGDSMEPRFHDGQVIYVKQQQDIESGETGVFLLNGDAYVKRIALGREPRLISLNPAYKPIAIRDDDDLRVIGRVVG